MVSDLGPGLKRVAGSKSFSRAPRPKGLIYDVLAVNPTSFAKHKEDWAKFTAIYYKCVDYLKDPATQEDAVKIMSAKVGTDAGEYAKNVSGTHFLTVAEAKTAYKKGDSLDSIYGSMTIGNKFNLDNKVYKVSQKPEKFLVPGVVAGLESNRTAPPSSPPPRTAFGPSRSGRSSRKGGKRDWLGLKEELLRPQESCSHGILVPRAVVLWCAVSYIPWLWHPLSHHRAG